jgi:hypothetical protein
MDSVSLAIGLFWPRGRVYAPHEPSLSRKADGAQVGAVRV